MKRRLILAAVSILILPLWFSPSLGDKPTNLAPFATVAYAGHTVGGNAYCQCGCEDCICDPVEPVGTCGQPANAVSDDTGAIGQVSAPAETDPSLDFGSGALFMALALFAWARFRGSIF